MKTRAYFIAIFGLIILLALFIQSRQSPTSLSQPSENTSVNKIDEHHSGHSHDATHMIDESLTTNSHDHDNNDLEQTLLAKERFYTESEIKAMTQEEFVQTLNDIERKLPNISELRKLPDEALHHTPAPIIHAGKEIGLIQEILDIHPSYESKALEFYERCITNKESPTPVRALCLTNLIGINNKNGIETPMKKYPQELIDLAKMIIDI